MMADNPSFRVVLLTQDGLEHRYVASRLKAAFPDALKAVVVTDPPPQSLFKRVGKWWRRYTIPQLVSRLSCRSYQMLRRWGARHHAAGRTVLFDGADPPELPEDILRRVPSHNGARCLALLDEIAPDIIAVYGTAMIRAPVFARARVAIVNMHTGLSPTYRGSDTVFWPLHDERPDLIGVTVHLIDEGIDSGAILATGRPSISADDDEHSLFFKCVVTGTPLYVEGIRALAMGEASPAPQSLDAGRCYLFVDRTLRAERRVGRLVRRGLLRRYAASQ